MNDRDSLADLPFKDRLEDGKAFEDFVAYQLYRVGLPFQVFRSRHFQWNLGEGTARIEVKHDRNFKHTGNLFIETRERRAKSDKWRSAGIYDATDPWIYVIGDQKTLFVFSVNELIRIDEADRFEEKSGATFEGFLLPEKYARRYAIAIIQCRK